MGSLKTFQEVIEIVKLEKKKGKKVGYITGCFDILHIGHIRLFKQAKEYVDILVVGLDSDLSIKLSKGDNRPVNPIGIRLEQISELRSVDYVFPFKEGIDFGSKKANEIHSMYLERIEPDILLAECRYDTYWKEKKSLAEKLNIQFVDINIPIGPSTTGIVDKLMKEN